MKMNNIIINKVSPKQDLTFSQLKIYYEENGYTLNEEFLKHLGFIMSNGKYNYLAYLMSDNNNISIKISTYSSNDTFELIETEEVGYCSLIKAVFRLIDKFDLINKTYTKITGFERKELKMFDNAAVREAIINAIFSNDWTKSSPKFEIFSNHLSITFIRGLQNNISKEDFFSNKYDFICNNELLLPFYNFNIDNLYNGGVKKIINSYDKSIFEFTEEYIKLSIGFNEYADLVNCHIIKDCPLNEIQKQLLELIKSNNRIKYKDIYDKVRINNSYILNQKMILENINYLKDNGYIYRSGSEIDGNGYWILLKKALNLFTKN